MFSGGFRSSKLKTNLKLSINRLKLLQKKKTEMALKARKEIADYLSSAKYERARIRVEHIIREDYYVEAMELVEMYCDLLLARYGLIESMKVVDEGLTESIASLIWVAPRMVTDAAELKMVSDQLSFKYGKEFAQACRSDEMEVVNARLKHKLSVKAPPKSLVENYLVAIAKNYNVEFEPDPTILDGEESLMIDFGDDGPGGGGQKQPLGPAVPYGGYPPPPAHPTDAMAPPYNGAYNVSSAPSAPHPSVPHTPAPPYSQNDPAYPPQFNGPPPAQGYPPPGGMGHGQMPPQGGMGPGQMPQPGPMQPGPQPGQSPIDGLPELPSVPAASFPPLDNTVGGESAGGEDVDFDDLSRRFEELKKKK